MAALLGIPGLLFGGIFWLPVLLALGALALVVLFVLMCVGYALPSASVTAPVPAPIPGVPTV